MDVPFTVSAADLVDPDLYRVNRLFQVLASQIPETSTSSTTSGTSAGTALSLRFIGVGGVIGSAYHASLLATGGTTPYTYSIVGSLPAGLVINPTTGAITGTPTTAGTTTFTGRVVDAVGTIATVPGSITITSGGSAPPAPNVTSATITVTPVKIGNDYNFNLSGTITIPSAATALATIIVSIIGLDTAACVINAPTGGFGTSATYQTPNYPMPLTAATYTLDFIAVSGSGVATASPYSNTVTVTPATISSVLIAEIGPRTITIGDQLTTISITPTLANLPGIQQITFGYSRDGGSNIYLIGWYPFYPGSTTALDLQVPIVASGLSGGLTSNNYIIYAVVGAQSSPWSPQTPISLAALLIAFPALVTSNTITLLPNAPTVSATLTITNVAGSAPTQANIYSGNNGLGDPYATLNISIATPGGVADPNTLFYSLYHRWEDSTGASITPGGVNNPPGYILIASAIPNNGQVFSIKNYYLNYPSVSVGANAYDDYYVYGLNQNAVSGFSGLQVPPFTGNPGAVLQASQLVQIGQPPTGLLGQQNTASVVQSPAISLIPDFNFSQDAQVAFPHVSQWSVNNSFLVVGSATVMNDGIGSSTGGIQNYTRLTGYFALSQMITVPTGQALYFAFAARSNNPSTSVITQVEQNGTASGMTPGTYTGIALNGAGGTGGTASITVTATTLTAAIITAGGSTYTPGTSFNVTVSSGIVGGSGITLTVFTSFHTLLVTLVAYDSNGSMVSVNGNLQNSLSISGHVTNWEQPAASATYLYPANVSYVELYVATSAGEPAAGTWDVTNILLQPVQNQVTGSQTNSQVPQNQTAGMSAVYSTSNSTSANSTYGLQYITLTDASGGVATVNVGSGDAEISLANGGIEALLTVTPSLAEMNVQGTFGVTTYGCAIGITSGGVSLTFVGGSPAITVNGHTAVTGATVTTSAGTKNIESGFITS